MSYTKGAIAGGWVHISDGETPIALVHPKYVDKFLAVQEMYEALKALQNLCNGYTEIDKENCSLYLSKILAKVDRKE